MSWPVVILNSIAMGLATAGGWHHRLWEIAIGVFIGLVSLIVAEVRS